MIRLIRAELYKLRTTPGPWVLGLATVLLTGLGITTAFVIARRGTAHFGPPTTVQQLRDLVGAGYASGVVLGPVLGVICVTTEFRHKVLTASLLIEPRRPRILIAKVACTVTWGVVLCLFSLGMVAAMGIPLLITQGGSVHAMLRQVGPVLPGLFGIFALMAVYGMGIGTLVKNQIAGVILALGISLVIEPIVVAIFSSLAHMDVNFLPSDAAAAVAGGLKNHALGGGIGVSALLSWWLGTLALVGWGLGTTVLGYFTTFKRDVT